jgi:predicted dehydrogenase
MSFDTGLSFDANTSYQQNANNIRAENAKGFIEINRAFGYTGQTCETHLGPIKAELAMSTQALQMDDFARCIQENRESRVSGEMGLRDMKIIEAIYESARTGKRVDVQV